jgi:hypothetical protein
MPCESAGYALLDSQGIASQSPKTAASVRGHRVLIAPILWLTPALTDAPVTPASLGG